MSDDPPNPQPDSTQSAPAASSAQSQSGAGNVQFGDHARVEGDVFTGGKRVVNTSGGDYFEHVTNVAAPPIGAAALHQLPAAPADFTGRQAELDQLRAAAGKGGAAIFGLRGQGGVGKTALALVLAHALAPSYPDAQIYLDLQGTTQPLAPGAVMAHAIRAFEPLAQLPDDPAGLASVYRSALAGRRVLLLYDNAATREQIAPLVPPPGCLLLVTSRQRFTLPGLHALNLEALPRDRSVELLLKIAPRIGPQADEIAALCGNLPLALRLAGSALAEREDLKPGDYGRKLSGERERLKELDEVAASLALSYALLPAPLQAAWRALAVIVGGFDRFSAAVVLDTDEDAAGAALSDLLRYSMVSYDAERERYRLHDLARLAADERLGGEERASAELRHAAHFREVLAAANWRFLEGNEGVLQGLALFDLERLNIEAGQAWAAANAETDEAAARLCSEYPDAGAHLLILRHHPRQRIAWVGAALAAARRLNDKSAEGVQLGNLGIAYAQLSEPRRAIECYEQQLLLTRGIGDRRGEGVALGNLGNAYYALGDPRRAIEYYEQAIVILREIGDRRGEGQALGNLGLTYRDLGQPRRAVEHHQQHLAIARELGDRHGEAVALGNLGNAYDALGEPLRAIEFYEQAIVIMREIGDRGGEGYVLISLGAAHRQLGEPRLAIEYHQQALIIDHEIGDRRGESYALGNLGSAYYALSDARRAIEYYEQALPILREIGDRRGEGNVLGNLGNAYDALGEPRQAIEFYEQALAVDRDVGDRPGEGNALGNLGIAYRQLGEPRRAIEFLEQQLQITREIGDRDGESKSSWNLGLIFEAAGELEKAIPLMQACVDFEREIGHPDVAADAARVEALRARLREGGEAPGAKPPG